MKTPLIDNLQYANFSPRIFEQMRAGGVDAVHVTIAYHESFREMVPSGPDFQRHQRRLRHPRTGDRAHRDLFRLSEPQPD